MICSVCIDLMKHKSSATFAVYGSNSLSHAPDCPCCANLKIDGAIGKLVCPAVIAVNRWPFRIESGRSVPCVLASCGL